MDIIALSISVQSQILNKVGVQERANRRFAVLLSLDGQDIKERGSLRVRSPFREVQILTGTTWSESAQSSQEREAVASDGEGGMAWYRLRRTYLSLAHAQEVLFVSMIDLDLPSVEISLNQSRCIGTGSIRVGGQQVSRVAIVGTCVRGELIGHGSDNEQPQSSGASAAFPQDALDLFIAECSPLSAEIDEGCSQGNISC